MSDAFGFAGATTRFDSVHGRTEGGLQHGSLRYPSPFFDIGHTYLPSSVSQMFKWCRYYFLTSPLINAVTYKMAEYPITAIVVDEKDQDLRDWWEDTIENKIKMRSFLIETGLDYFCYGNAFISIHFPFEKYLICQNCKYEQKVQKANYKFRNLQYFLACDKCNVSGEAKIVDLNVKNLKGIRPMRWNPEHVKVEHNDVTGETDYFLDLPTSFKNDVMMGKRHILESTPHVFIEAMRANRTLKFAKDNVFHLKRPTIAQKDMGWGMPLILPVLKDTYYLQILRKAQEAIAQQHIVPLRILFPQAGSASSDPYSTTDLGMWRRRIEVEIQKWRSDPNYIPVLPLPVGNEVVGGEGKALMLHQEMRAWSEQIVAGMHVPIEFVFGGLQYSGSNVSMRMLENQFLGYRTEQLILCRDFILGRIASYMGIPRPKIHFKRFRMADDLQRIGLVFQANQAMKISDTTLLDEMDLDVVTEEKHKGAELNKQLDNQRRMQLAQAALQGEVMKVSTRYQIESQKLMTAAGMPPPVPPGQGAQVPGAEEMGGPFAGGGGPGGEQQPMQGEQAAPGMPEGATVYPENAEEMPTEGIPPEMLSPQLAAQKQNGMSVAYLARRATTELEKMPDGERYTELLKMKGTNPQMYQVVLQLLQSSKGSQRDDLNPLQMPMPEMKPPRRQTPIV
jgi:hypothetical protein